MDPSLSSALGIVGALAALSFSAVGSALGTGNAANAAIGAWKRCYAQGKPASFMQLTFIGAPLSQTIYGMVVMFSLLGKVFPKADEVTGAIAAPFPGLAALGVGIFAGLAIGWSAWYQGRAAAAAADAFGETDKGFSNYLAALGVIETVAIFMFVLAIIALGSFK